MQDIERTRSLHVKAAYLIEEYRRIVEEFLPGCESIAAFVEMFSDTFQDYQESSNKKMDPDSIRDRKVSCSSAAALAGIWWMDRFPQLLPVFMIEDTGNSFQSKSSAHVNVAFPLEAPITEREAMVAFYDPQRSRPDIMLLDWTTHSKMKLSNPNRSYPVYPISGVQEYVRNRLVTLGISKKYSTKNGILSKAK